MDGVYIERPCLLHGCTAIVGTSIMATSIPLLSNPAHHSPHYDFPSPPPFNTSKYHFYKGHILQEMANPDPDMGRLKLMRRFLQTART
jgi:hypothetical protein